MRLRNLYLLNKIKKDFLNNEYFLLLRLNKVDFLKNIEFLEEFFKNNEKISICKYNNKLLIFFFKLLKKKKLYINLSNNFTLFFFFNNSLTVLNFLEEINNVLKLENLNLFILGLNVNGVFYQNFLEKLKIIDKFNNIDFISNLKIKLFSLIFMFFKIIKSFLFNNLKLLINKRLLKVNGNV